MARAWLFPGQGSQRRGMGAELLDAYPDLVAAADDVLGYSVREACQSSGRLSDTRYVQPLLFVVNALHLRRALKESPPPDYLAGHSLGEISALHAAGCIDFAAGLELVRRRGALMAACPPGAMMAVLGLPVDQVEDLIASHGLTAIDIANHNLPDQVVVAGPDAEVGRLASVIEGLSAGRTSRLNVAVAAHSRYMRPAVAGFTDVLATIDFAVPRIPVFAGVTAAPHEPGAIGRRLREGLTGRVRWWEVMVALSRVGVDDIREVGPGEVLQRMWRRAGDRLPGAAPQATAPPPVLQSREPQSREPQSREPQSREPQSREPQSQEPQSQEPPRREAPRAPASLSAPGVGREEAQVPFRPPYLVDALPYGVSGPVMLRCLASAGILGFLGTFGVPIAAVTADVRELATGDTRGRWGIELPAERLDPARTRAIVSLALDAGVTHAVTPGWSGVSPEIVRWRFARQRTGPRRLLVRVTGGRQAEAFLRAAPAEIVTRMVRSGQLDPAEAEDARRLPVATAICVQLAPDGGVPASLLLSVVRAARDAAESGASESSGASGSRAGRTQPVPVGVGGIGAPEDIAAALLLGADFLVTGVINACSPQARTSQAVRELLSTVHLADTVLAPSAELFRFGGRAHLLRKSTLFPARAARLHELQLAGASPAALPAATRRMLESDYFGQPLDEVLADLAGQRDAPDMADVLARYFDLGTRAALDGRSGQQLNWHVSCGPEMGAFNLAAAGLGLADWRTRDVDVLARRLMAAGVRLLDRRLRDVLHHFTESAEHAEFPEYAESAAHS